MLLVTDVEALAPADEPGPLATVFRQVLAETLRAGAAVVCTTSRPEAVDPALRAPDLLSLRITVPLPDPALRREQLTVLTRQVPLADDVRLDEVAGRTPGFVAADLAALVREAGVRAALRQKSAETPTRGDGRLHRRPGGGPADHDGRVDTGAGLGDPRRRGWAWTRSSRR